MPYLDNFLIHGQTREKVITALRTTEMFLTSLGWKIHLEKSVRAPSQSITFLGYIIDTKAQKSQVNQLDNKLQLQNKVQEETSCPFWGLCLLLSQQLAGGNFT